MEYLLETKNIYHMLDLMSDVALCVDNELRIAHINPAAEVFFGFSRNEAAGQDVARIVPKEYREVHRRFLLRCQREDPLRLRGRLFRLKIICQSSIMRVPVSLSLSLINTEEGLNFIVLIRRRMSMSVFSENHLFPYHDPKNSLAAVCHEIKNPLVAIGGFARRVANDKGLGEKSRHELDIIQQEVGRLERLVNGLRDLYKGAAYRFEYADLVELLRHLHEIMLQQAREENKLVSLEVMPATPRLLLDRDRISQVLMNLTRNALQACATGGQVRVRLKLAEREGLVRIDVIDNGQGMSEETLKKIFQPFFTTKKGGTGLGLPVSKRIIEDHGGFFQIHSQIGQGTTISIYLPF